MHALFYRFGPGRGFSSRIWRASPAGIDYDKTVDRGEGRIVAVGNFDGVHRGHQAVLVDTARDAAERGLHASVLTFAPHPAEVLGRPAPPKLTTLPRKLEL